MTGTVVFRCAGSRTHHTMKKKKTTTKANKLNVVILLYAEQMHNISLVYVILLFLELIFCVLFTLLNPAASCLHITYIIKHLNSW